VPRPLPQIAIDNKNVLDNEGALNLTAVPKKLGIIGSGVIGLEMGSVWKRVGSQVTILEAAPTFLAAADQQIAKEAFKYFTKEQGLSIELGVKIGNIKSDAKGVSVEFELATGEKKNETFDKLIVSIGRIPNTNGLPGINQLRTIVGAVMTIGLILSVLALIVSAIVWGFGANSSNPHLASRGKIGVLVSCGAAVICGASVTLINFFWNVGQSV